MIKLMHNDVDGYMSVRAEFDVQPTKDELREVLLQFHDKQESETAAEELYDYYEAHINDSSNTYYELL